MNRFWAVLALLVFLVCLPALEAAESRYETGRIVAVEKKSHERVLYYLVNTPVTRDDPYYELSLQVNQWVYLAEYTPRHVGDNLPDDWKPGVQVEMKIADKHHAWVRGPGGFELQLAVVKRIPAAGDTVTPNPVPVQK